MTEGMKRLGMIIVCAWATVVACAQIDMQAHMASDEGQVAYGDSLQLQTDYYTGAYAPTLLRAASGDTLFGLLNTLMGNTCRIGSSTYSYNSLRNEYVKVDRDLNREGNIIGYYDGYSFAGVWDAGATWNREHTWPQSKGANKDTPMGHDMQSVRPTRTSVNSHRGNTPYGEGANYYDPDSDCSISNSYYVASNMGTYRGDAARVILYDYIVYGRVGDYQNDLYNGNAQLLSKLGTDGVFESIPVLLKWHMQDPPSLTEMVRNNGAEIYQGNRNPFIDYPELAVQMLQNQLTTYAVNVTGVQMYPQYTKTTQDGFVAYLGSVENHPQNVQVEGARYTYDAISGRLVVSHVASDMQIIDPTGEINGLLSPDQDAHPLKVVMDGRVLIRYRGQYFDVVGQLIR